MVKERDNKAAQKQMCVKVSGVHAAFGGGEQTPLFIMKARAFEVSSLLVTLKSVAKLQLC